MVNINYQKEMEKIIKLSQSKNIKPTLLLHACCAPCSSYVLEYLKKFFKITVFFYNPNIYPVEEFNYRASEIARLIKDMKLDDVDLVTQEYDGNEFFDIAKGLENAKEGSDRCFKCYELRLERTAQYAKKYKFDYFTTTLTISPLKNAAKLNEIGSDIAKKYELQYLFSDFKKKEGYKRSIELSREYNLYRQNYCGCVYSKNQSLDNIATT